MFFPRKYVCFFWEHILKFHKDNFNIKIFSSKNCRDLTLVFMNTLRLVAEISATWSICQLAFFDLYHLATSLFLPKIIKWHSLFVTVLVCIGAVGKYDRYLMQLFGMNHQVNAPFVMEVLMYHYPKCVGQFKKCYYLISVVRKRYFLSKKK